MTGNFTTEKPTSKICKNIFYKSYLFLHFWCIIK